MQARGWTVSWLGTTHGIENTLVPAAGLPLVRVAFAGLRGKGAWHAIKGALRLPLALWKCGRTIALSKAQVVLGMGGYVCVPAGFAAFLLRKPLVLMNADARLLLSNRLLRPLASQIAFGFEGPSAEQANAVVTGNPVRKAIADLPIPESRFEGRSGPLKLLIVGGSLGARVLNQTLPQALAFIPAEQRPQVTHQTGSAERDAVAAAYAAQGLSAHVLAFIDDMPGQLADCDVVVCRAGAITVSELCAAGVAAVLVPLVVGSTSHQRDNAAWLASHDAAWHLPQPECTAQRLAELLTGLGRETLLAVAHNARSLARPEATARVADVLEEVAAA
jgi:UDP-N-acetylglucosamine--N-acetylmuramyl-(pentapeptide) pyrophosphoryl-undecaprenol N-acetylglucosamine transferase